MCIIYWPGLMCERCCAFYEHIKLRPPWQAGMQAGRVTARLTEHGILVESSAGKAFQYYPLCCWWLNLQLQNDAKILRNHWNHGKWVLIWEYSSRAIQWIPTWQGLDGFQKSLHPCASAESSLSIRRVITLPLQKPASFINILTLMLMVAHLANTK